MKCGALRELQREQGPKSPLRVHPSERGSPFTTAGFARMLERAGEAASVAGRSRPPQHPPVRYTELSPGRFKDFWR